MAVVSKQKMPGGMVVFIFGMLISGWLVFADLYIYSKLGLILFVFVALFFLDRMGKRIPIKELIAMIMLLQMIAVPAIVYNNLDNDVRYPMEIDEKEYMLFVFYSIVCFIAGLFIPLQKRKIDGKFIVENLRLSTIQNGRFGIGLIAIGFISGLAEPFIPGALKFLFFLLENCKYVGAFYLFFSSVRFKYLWMALVYAMLIYETVGRGLFINMFIWTFLLSIIVSFRYRINLVIKTVLFIGGIFIAFFVQSFKTEYRAIIWEGEQSQFNSRTMTRQEIFLELATSRAENTEELYEHDNYRNFISRLNQGWILAKVLKHVPFKEPFTEGETVMHDIRSAIVPRILDPNKALVGGVQGADKFYRFTGKQLIRGTRMTIGILGDAYVNFGSTGGWVFMFAFGLFLNYILVVIYRISWRYPGLVLWIPFVFFYAMRAENELLVILNFLTKSSVVVFIIFWFNKHRFRRIMTKD
ncbi:MAG: hypothetical protein JKX74_03355 [Flavobacteriales bacterium]|nr:hypothetical protein [Flavobacteriales bacterium]